MASVKFDRDKCEFGSGYVQFFGQDLLLALANGKFDADIQVVETDEDYDITTIVVDRDGMRFKVTIELEFFI